MLVGEYLRQKESENESMSTRGFTEDEVFYQYMPDDSPPEERRRVNAVAAVAGALRDLEQIKEDIEAVRSLLYVVRVSRFVLEDIHQLCHGFAAATEATSCSRSYLTGRASAAQRRDQRELRRITGETH